MAVKENCWEAKKCGREPGGEKVSEFGPCPAATDTSADGLNGGKNGGRVCWAISGTFCSGNVQGRFAQERNSCLTCDFFQRVCGEEDDNHFVLLPPSQTYKAAINNHINRSRKLTHA